MIQPPLLPLPHYCHNCRQFVATVYRARRFRLCPDCWRAIVPAWAQFRNAETPQERAQVAGYFEWYETMNQQYPARGRGRSGIRAAQKPRPIHTDNYWPLCECGREREELCLMSSGAVSLFGGSRMHLCPHCEARRAIDSIAGMADKLHPDWDDEAWLDLLYRSHRRAFDLGILPDYWFDIRRKLLGKTPSTD